MLVLRPPLATFSLSTTSTAYDNLTQFNLTGKTNHDTDNINVVNLAAGSSVTTTTTYLGALYEQIDKSDSPVTEYKNYIYAGKQRVAIYTTKSDASPSTTRYIHTDHLGSIDTITKEDGTVEESLSYDAFGKRRTATNWSVLGSLLAVMNTNRGFTGHEHLDDVGLIHMNGRVYDPTLGRFLSADPFVQLPKSTQGFNRYTYVNNNPLSYTDPSGFFLGKLFKAFRKGIKKLFKSKIFQAVVRIIAYAVSIITQQYWIAGLVDGAFAKINGASWGQAFKAGITTFASMYAIGEIGGQGWGIEAEIAGYGIVGGTQSEIMGGKFSDGFYASAFARFARPWVQGAASFTGRVIRSMVAGGAGAVFGGGKFKNGAVTGAFSYVITSKVYKSLVTNRNISRDQGNSDSVFTGEKIMVAGPASLPENSCGPGTVSCIANGTGGIGGYEDGGKLARYACINSGGTCSFVAPSNGEHVFGADGFRDTYYNGKFGTAATRVERFTVDPNSWWDRHIRFNSRFIDGLRNVQRK